MNPDVAGGLPGIVDISCVQAFHRREDVLSLAATARRGGFVAAHVLPTWVPELREALQGSTTLVGAPVGFPTGGSSTAVKVAEARGLLQAGAQELDVVVAVGRLLSGQDDRVRDDLAAVVTAVRDTVGDTVPVRAILEVGHLDDDTIRRGCEAAVGAGVDWVKSATGWSGVPTTVTHVATMAAQVQGRAGLKAAGGIRDLATVAAMRKLGVTRFGMNAGVAVALTALPAQGSA